MPTKTDRILSYLPGTFRAVPRPTTLYSVVNAFGNELLQAENTLAAVMQSHWVDLADRGEDIIDDLARIASLYGLAPRDDESVEEFRDHLKRYVRTFLEGTPTLQGILRVTAEALGLRIADGYDELDTWWTRPDPWLTTVEPRGDDARLLLFDRASAAATGVAAAAARLVGQVDISGPIDVRQAPKLSIGIDGAAPAVIDLAALLVNPAAARLTDLVAAINTGLGESVAEAVGGTRLALTSQTLGAASRLVVGELTGDAAPALLALAPRLYQGSDADTARVVGANDLSGGVNLSDRRYLRLLVDGTMLAEIDCAGANPAATTLDEIVAAINGALAATLASHDGRVLILRSPTIGFASTIQFQHPAAQEASGLLFGPLLGIYTGSDPQPASVTGRTDLSGGIDLSHSANIAVSFAGGPDVTISCVGAAPASTRGPEIVAAINAASGAQVASFDGKFLTLISPTQGSLSTVAFGVPPAGDATFDLFGIAARAASGHGAEAASLSGIHVAGGTIDVAAQHLLQIAIDGAAPVVVDLRAAAANPRAATLAEVAAAIDAAVGAPVAAVSDHHLVLTSPAAGKASRVAVLPLDRTVSRPFVTRAFIVDDAAQRVLGVFQQQATGTAAAPARVEGTVDLSRGVDLRDDPRLQVRLDGGAPITIDCTASAPRPRAVLPEEIVGAINAAAGRTIASHDGRRLVWTSPTAGAGSRIEFEPVLAGDAAAALGLQPGTTFGHDAVGVQFLGTVDLAAGIDLSAASHVKIAIDVAPAVEIDCAGADPVHTNLGEIVTRINTGLGVVCASPNGAAIALSTPTKGAASRIQLLAPAAGDATRLIFGVGSRSYHGENAAPPAVTGAARLDAGVDLRVANQLQIAVDGGALKRVDCSAGAVKPEAATLAEIVSAINAATGQPIASAPDGSHLLLTGPTVSVSGRLTIAASPSDGAFAKVMGAAPKVTTGEDAAPATITGTVDLLAGANLDERRILRIVVDAGRAVDIDISGAKPAQTFLDEIVGRINAVLPGVAAPSGDERLMLRSPTRGESSRLSVEPVRALEVVEYQPVAATLTRSLQHGGRFTIDHNGAVDATIEIEIQAPKGVAAPELVNRATGQRIRLVDAVPSGGTLRIARSPQGTDGRIVATITPAGGAQVVVPSQQILAGPIGARAVVPFAGVRHLSAGADGVRTLQLDDPGAGGVTILGARSGVDGSTVSVAVVAAVAANVARAFDVTIEAPAADGSVVLETYRAVTVGSGVTAPANLTAAILRRPSAIVLAHEQDKAAALVLGRGRSEWSYLAADGARFDSARFDAAVFPGAICFDQGVFDVSAFANAPPEIEAAVFAGPQSDPAVDVTLRWTDHQPGSFVVNLPGDLPERFGARFDQARFGGAGDAPEPYPGVVMEPPGDPDFARERINSTSSLVKAAIVPRVPLGWSPVFVPFRNPRAQKLTGGTDSGRAAIYIGEQGLPGFLALTAQQPGTWGNSIEVTARKASPARFDLTIGYSAARFESARVTALAGAIVPPGSDPLPALTAQALEPRPVGVLQGKAAGVLAAVTRDRTESID